MGILATLRLETGRDVIRTFGLTGLCLALLGGLLATKVVSAPAPEPVTVAGQPGTKAPVPSQDTLAKADRFTVVYLARSAENQPLLSITRADRPEPINTDPRTSTSLDRPAATAKKVAVLLPKPRPMIKPVKPGEAGRFKNASELKSCRQQDAIANFLISAGIAPRCES